MTEKAFLGSNLSFEQLQMNRVKNVKKHEILENNYNS
jgi:hypothetical protein